MINGKREKKMITRKTPSKGISMIKVLLEERIFNELFKDNIDYDINEILFEEQYNPFGKIISIKKK